MRMQSTIVFALLFCSLAMNPIINSYADTNQDVEKYSNWLTFYYLEPNPDWVVPAMQTFSKSGMLDKESSHAPMIAFLSIIFRENKSQITTWNSQLQNLPEFHKSIIWEALWLSDTEEGKKCLQDIIPNIVNQDVANQYKQLFTQTPPSLLEMPIVSPAELDMMWAAFSATGNENYVIRIIKALELIKSKDLEATLVGRAAKWSLTTNCVQHKKVMLICEEQTNKASEEIKAILKEILIDAKK